MTEASLIIKVDASQVDKGKKSLDSLAQSGAQAETGTKKAESGINAMSSAAKVAAGVLGALGVSMSVQTVVRYADEWQNASNRLRLVTQGSTDLANVQRILLQTANDTRAGFAGTAELFTVLTRSTKDLGLSQSEIIALTKTLNQSFAVSGASAGAMDGAIRQLSQGLQSGALRGDEFNSVAEQAPGILDAVAASLKMGRGELRDFAATGGITSQVLVKAIQDYADVIADDFSKAQMTFGQSMLVAKNNMLEFVGSSKAVQGGLSSAGKAVAAITENLDDMAAVVGIAALSMGGQYVLAMGAGASATGVMTAAASNLRAMLLLLGGPAGIIGIVAGATYLLVQRQKEAAEAADQQSIAFDQVRAKLGAMTEGELARAMQAEFEHTQELIAKRDRLQELTGRYGTQEEAIRKLNVEIEASSSNHALLRGQMDRVKDGFAPLNEGMIDFISMMDNAADQSTQTGSAYVDLMNKTGALSNATIAVNKSTRDFIGMMDSAAIAAGNSEAAYAKLAGMTVETYTRTTRLTQAQRDTVLTNQDAADSIDDIVQGMTTQSEASESLARVTEMMRDDISSAFADMLTSGENVFDSIAKSFERMLAKMVADWAAAGIMNLVSKAFGGTGGHTSVLGGILSGGASAAGSAAVGAVTGTAGTAGAAAAGGGILSGAGSAISGAASSVGSAAMGIIKAIPGWGWALGGAALVAKLLDDSGTMSSNSGILLSDLPGVAADRKRDTPAYASGVDPVLFARRDSFDNAMQVSEALRAADAAVMEIYGAAGKSFRITGPELAGFDEKGGGFGQFFGVAAEDGNVALTAQQSVEKYVRELISAGNRYTGTNVVASGSVDDMLAALASGLGIGVDGSHAAGLDYVPFDGYRAMLHKGERVQTAQEARMTNTGMTDMVNEMRMMYQQMTKVAAATARTADLLRRVTRDGESLVTVAA